MYIFKFILYERMVLFYLIFYPYHLAMAVLQSVPSAAKRGYQILYYQVVLVKHHICPPRGQQMILWAVTPNSALGLFLQHMCCSNWTVSFPLKWRYVFRYEGTGKWGMHPNYLRISHIYADLYVSNDLCGFKIMSQHHLL